MEPATSTSAYMYDPLPSNSSLSFRVFSLYPAHQFSAPIQGKLRIFSLSTSDLERCNFESFEALSYAWGDAAVTGTIEFPDQSHLPIAANLESFLRYRREREAVVMLWIDAICINQKDNEEKSSQVQAMSQIYILAYRLSVWLGPPSDDSSLGMNSLPEIGYEHAFVKLSMSPEECVAIGGYCNRAWCSRAWIVQELAHGSAGTKYGRTTVRCGSDCLLWSQLVIACSRIYVNALNLRQRLPSVRHVLSLDTLPSRGKDEVFGSGESYPHRLLQQLAKHRQCLASNPRDKIYAMLGLWVDSLGLGKQNGLAQRAAPTVNYDRRWEDVYVDFAIWIIYRTRSLGLLSHCQPNLLDHSGTGSLPTWVPDWSQSLDQVRLPCVQATHCPQIPWWSLPIRSGAEGEGRIQYHMQDQPSRDVRAKEILRPHQSTLHLVPEWFVDMLDPDGTEGGEALFKELQRRPDVFFVSPDESDRELGNDDEDMQTTSERTQIHNERCLQEQVLSHYVEGHMLLKTQYKACANTTFRVGITGRSLNVEGILVDSIREVFDTFPEDIEKDWTASTLLMVQIGQCKQAILGQDTQKSPYPTEISRLIAFWRTLFAGQQASDETNITSWLPLVPHDWQWSNPSLTVLESGRLEHAKLRIIVDAFAEYYMSMAWEAGTSLHTGFDEYLAKDDRVLDARWSSADRLEYARLFESLSKDWLKQPYDLYHRPFKLPYVAPDPYWDSRRLHDNVALDASIQARHRSVIESLDAETRELRREARRFVSSRIRSQPARETPSTNETRLIEFSLGRRLFVSEAGYFGLAPPNARKGDQVAVLFGAETPFILRRAGSGFQVVGESYVHGLMDGEAINKWRLGLKEVRNIVLV